MSPHCALCREEVAPQRNRLDPHHLGDVIDLVRHLAHRRDTPEVRGIEVQADHSAATGDRANWRSLSESPSELGVRLATEWQTITGFFGS